MNQLLVAEPMLTGLARSSRPPRTDELPLDARASRPRHLAGDPRVRSPPFDCVSPWLNSPVARSYEFRQNEFVTSMKSVSLASKSTRTGTRDFVAVGTAIHRAEDLATRGGVSRGLASARPSAPT